MQTENHKEQENLEAKKNFKRDNMNDSVMCHQEVK